MKSLQIVSFLLAFACQSYAQDDAISKYFNKYSNDDRFTSIYISNKMFGLFAHMDEGKEDRELKEVLSKLGGLRILSADIADGKRLYQEAHSTLVTKGFEDLMVIKEKTNSELKFLVMEVNGKIRELLLLSGQQGKFFLLSIIGDIDVKKISRLSKSFDVDGLENLNELNENNTKSKK